MMTKFVIFLASVSVILCIILVPLLTLGHGGDDDDEVPSWVTTNTNPTKRANWPEMQALTRDKVAKASHPLDLLLLGDSITAFHSGTLVGKVQGTPDVWNTYFGANNTLPLGIPGDKIGNVAWRLIYGGEKPPIDPKIVVLHIGINDIGGSVKSTDPDPAGRMEYLLEWIGLNMPNSKIGVMAILPTTYHNYKALNGALQPVVEAHKALWIECGQDMHPKNTTLIADNIHPTAAGHDIILKCLSLTLSNLL